MTGQDALWSALEVRTQSEQCPGQVTVWDALAELDACEGYGAEPVTPSNVEVTR